MSVVEINNVTKVDNIVVVVLLNLNTTQIMPSVNKKTQQFLCRLYIISRLHNELNYFALKTMAFLHEVGALPSKQNIYMKYFVCY